MVMLCVVPAVPEYTRVYSSSIYLRQDAMNVLSLLVITGRFRQYMKPFRL